MKRFFLCVLPFVLALAGGGAAAQDALRIAAVVNDRVISVYDLSQQLSLVLMFAGVSDTAENRQRLAPQVLRTMIDDELKRQEAARGRIRVSDGEIKRHIRGLERINGLSPGEIDDRLAKRGIDAAVLAKRIKADIGWTKLVGLRFGRRYRVSDEEIDEIVKEIEKNKGKPEFRVAEIFLPVDRPEYANDVRALANKLTQQLRAGASFSALARNFSKSPTASRGGDLGWSRLGQLGNPLDNVIAGLQVGQVSPPIATANGIYILHLKDRRTAGGLEDSDAEAASAVVNLQQLFLPIDKGASPSDVAAVMGSIRKIGDKSKSCDDLDRAAKELEAPLSGNLGDIKINALGPQQRTLVRGLPPLQASQPLRVADGVIVLMVCRRDEPEKAAVTLESRREQIADRLLSERLGQAARVYLRDLRRAAFVDVRL